MKKIISSILLGSMVLASLAGCQKNASGLTPVTLNEVAHSIFYAPQYAAIELGYFKDEGIELTLVNGAGADKVMTALISKEADIGFMGSEASIYAYAGKQDDYAINFAQLTQRAGNFLVGREPEADFQWENLAGKKVLGGRAGGMPSHDVTWEH
ncbi:MAG: ABC transporter substrate-binding protein, partial [Lachnospiraceae bacterium]|nr:ABC transporter substrate-binding protein [Lachnospiraceae bacterium]